MFDAVEPIIFALSEYIMLRSNISFFCEAKDLLARRRNYSLFNSIFSASSAVHAGLNPLFIPFLIDRTLDQAAA